MLAMKRFLIKNCLAVISLSTVSASLFAMDFICGEYGSSEKNLKYSTCSWTSAIHFSAIKLTGKPGQNDMLWIRESGYHLDIDRDLSVKTFKVGFNASCTAQGRSLKTKGAYIQQICSGTGNDSVATFKNCVLDIGGIVEFGTHHESTSMSIAYLNLEDTKFNAKGPMTFIVDSMKVKNEASRGGIIINMSGKSELNINDELILDSLLRENPKEWIFKVAFNSQNGFMPKAHFKKADLASCDIEIKVDEKMKPGKYVLFEIDNSRGSIDKLNKLTVNSKECSLGDKVPLGAKREISVYAGGAGRDSRTKNDIIMEIK